ncbi:DUF2141 domain-containing protein [Blastomonas aquatica]|uniref:DUF2141 domain-containing protein n=1 Tax=Blastomonas aquatica TaxID=1510276 RepID=A0ABQ1J8Q4_9SPHN|nr:DUF2141 domain-containing protein [Blastomonas aquatica]GGB62356.1 hypothetical protein GCM10010833_16660 [Blastomonas aquatica]
MIGRIVCALGLLACAASSIGAPYPVPPRAERGKANAACRPGEPGPAIRVKVTGIKDGEGSLRLDLYPANDTEFLAPDKELIAAGRPFRRIERKPLVAGTATLCIRAPEPGHYALSVLHDRDGDGKFAFLRDGVGFSRNPRLRRAKPKASSVAIKIGPGIGETQIVMNYRRGLGFGPVPVP